MLQRLDLLYGVYVDEKRRIKTANQCELIYPKVKREAEELTVTTHVPQPRDKRADYCLRGYMYGAMLMFADALVANVREGHITCDVAKRFLRFCK